MPDTDTTDSTTVDNTAVASESDSLSTESDNVSPSDADATDLQDESQSDDEPDTFPREYVEKLRKESAGYRERAQTADTLARRLHVALVAATGRLADPTDLPFDEDHIADADTLAAALDELLARKPHLASRRPTGEIGQGATSSGTGGVDLAGLLRGRA